MTFRFFVIASFLVFAASGRASVPAGWEFQVPKTMSGPLPTGTPTGALLSSTPEPESIPEAPPQALRGMAIAASLSSSGNIADEITPEIQNLADSLKVSDNDYENAMRIFEFVLSSIDYEHYYGSKKGAHFTLLEGAGNDKDQSSLLVAIMRAAGYDANYVTIANILPYDTTAPYYASADPNVLCSAVSWLGLAPIPYPGIGVNPGDKPAGWSDDEFKKSFNLFIYFKNAGFPSLSINSSYKSCIIVPRTIVKATVGGLTVYWDPSAKTLTGKTGMDMLAATGFNKTSFLTAAGGTLGTNYISGLNTTAIQTQLTSASTALVAAIKANRPNDSFKEILGRKETVIQNFFGFGSWIQVDGFLQADESDALPESVMSTLLIQINNDTPHEIKMPALQGKRLSALTSGNTVQIWHDDTIIHTATLAGAATIYNIKLTAKHPHFGDDGITPNHDRDDGGPEYKKNASYALIYGFATSKRYLQSRQRMLDKYIDAVRTLNPALVGANGSIDLPNLSDATLKRQVTTELLNVMGLNWLYQTEQVNQMAASMNGMTVSMFHRFGRMAQEESGGFYIDVPLSFSNNFQTDGINDKASPYALTFIYLSSALEHGLIDQYNLSANGAVSTVQIMHLANASADTNKNKIYQATSANWSAVQSQLIGYSTAQITAFSTKIASGSTLYIPKNANNGSVGWTWNGSGYVEFNPTTFQTGMIISGGYAGGYSISSTYVNPAPVVTNYSYSPNYYSTGGASNVINRTTPSYNVPSYFGADPVDMATGAMVFNKEDLSLGQSGVRGLTFQRHYSSNRRTSDAAKLGYGWTHNYEMKAVVRTATEAGLGETTPAEAAQMMAATLMLSELMKDNTLIKPMVSGALLAKVAVDNLLNNAVSLTMGKDTVQFIKQPDGTYTPPAGSTISLSKSGNFYLATERFGNTYKFDTTSDGRIVEVKDFFNKTLSLAYNGNGLNTVTDAYGRTLTLGYTSGRISSVTDSTGRSVQFGHTNGTITTATDPENKTSTFVYDSERRLTELKDPENRTIVINRYDSESRVYEQDSEGDPSKMWKLSFTGLRNTEIDPEGGQKVYFYDRRGRPTGVQDALGNRTAMIYDGQDHMIERQTAKGEVYKQTFNADHDVTEAENPIGVKTIYPYDSLKRVDQVTVQDTDAATPDRVTGLEYTGGNLSNLPNKITDPKGNITRRTYYADGNLNTAVEESVTGNRTTTYFYDTRGMPQTTTYHDNISEGFVYSVRGDLTSQTDRRGNTTSFLYNNRRQPTQTTQPGNRITYRSYDDSANLLTITDPLGNVARFTYSATGKTLTETIAYGTPEAETTTHVYDARDWKDYTLDPRAQKTDFGYDQAGRVTSILNPLLHETTFDYDANGQRVLTRTPLGHETLFAYTALGQEDAMQDPAGNVVDYGYNAYGERKELKNRRDNSFEFFYDANGNPTITETPLGHAVTKTWNDRNLIGTVEKASGQTTTYVYDHLRRVYTQTDPVGTITFGYDNNGNPETVTEGSSVLTRTWDALNRPQSYTNARGQAIGYQYYDNGLLWKLTYPGNRVVTYSYYPTNRLKTVVDWAGRTTTYSWDSAGRLTGVTRPNGVTRANQYDNANRLERIYERDSAGRLLVYFKYGHDDDGRITSRYRLPQPQPFTVPASAASYDADNRLEFWNSQSVIHDADGNMTSGPLGAAGFVSYNYDARNRLTSVGTAGSGFTYHAYDSENNRVSVTNAAGVTQYLVDPHGDALPRVLVREKPDTSTTTYVYGIGLLYEVNDATSDAAYYHFDNIGNTAALTGPTGTITDRVEYTPYGKIAYRSGTTDTPFLYVGQLGVMQEANGLIYMRARYYSPETQRFVNADPIGFAGGPNWYAYANGNPVMMVDPDGLQAEGSWALMGMGGAGMSGWANPQSAQALGSAMAAAQQTGYDVNKVASAAADAEFNRNVDQMAETYVTTTIGLATVVYAAPAATVGGPQLAGAARTGLTLANDTQLAVLARVANAGKLGDKAYMGLAKGMETLAKTPPGSRIGWGSALGAAANSAENWIDSFFGTPSQSSAPSSFIGSGSTGETGRK
jgi:RHS repeat-associated protein